MGHCFQLLKYRVLLVLTALMAGYLLVNAIIGSLTIMPSFVALDRAEGLTNLRRCIDSIEREKQHIAATCSDWGMWDDTYKFVVDRNQEYVNANLVPETMENASRTNLQFILNTKGQVVAHVLYDSKLGGSLNLPEFPETTWAADHPLLRHEEPDSTIQGLIMTRLGPILVASHPIVTSKGEGPIRGTIVVGRFLNQYLVAALRRDIHLDFTLRDPLDKTLSPDEQDIVADLSRNTSGILRSIGDTRQRGYALLQDIYGKPAQLLVAELDRGIVAKGRMAMRYVQASNVGVAILMLVAIYWLMRQLVLKRIADMSRAVLEIDASGDRTLRVPVAGKDELTSLAGQINHMLEQIETSEQGLRESQRLAEETNRAKSRFLSNVSHEIRTPMNGIAGFCEVILLSQSLEAAKKHAGIILRESGVLLMLVNDLLDLSRLEAGKLSVERTRFDLRQLLSEIEQTVGMQANNKGLRFEIAIDSQVPAWVWGDPLRLRQVLLNLTTNAIKFTDAGQVDINVECQTTNDGNRLCFGVHDTGIGIPPEKLDAIFDAFTQADISTTRKYGGSGLGLAIVRQLVCLMGGRMNVESQPGIGSAFSFWLPLEPVLEPGIENTGQDTGEQRIEKAKQPAHVLIADDYPTNREVAQLFLEEAGHHVVVASNGNEAVQACDKQGFDVIVLDVQMPVMDGLEAVNHIRLGTSPNANRPILALTASADKDTHDICMQAGFSEVITKPIRRAALLAAVAGWRDREHAAQEKHSQDPMQESFGDCPKNLPPIDIETALLEFGGAETLNSVLSTFIATATGQVSDLRDAMVRQERTLIRSIAHALKGGASTLEAMPLAQAAASLNNAAATAEFDQLRQLVEDVAQQLNLFVQCVQESSHYMKGCSNA